MAQSEYQDTIVIGTDFPLVINFTFNVPNNMSFGLDGFNDISVRFGEETYTLLVNPTIVVVNTNLQLQLNLGTTSETYPSYLCITGYNSTYPNGYPLTSKCLGNLHIPKMCNGC